MHLWFSDKGVDGGFNSKDPECEETYSIVILPDFVTLPFPSVELPEKVGSPANLSLFKDAKRQYMGTFLQMLQSLTFKVL